MRSPFPGMDPYVEHPMNWHGFHVRLIVAIADSLQPFLDPRYVATIEQRIVSGTANRRQHNVRAATVEPRSRAVTFIEVDTGPVKQRRVEIRDTRDGMRLVTAIEVVSPSNKVAGDGRKSYVRKQAEFLASDCHLVEIDLLRRGQHVVAAPETRVREEDPAFDQIVSVSRWPNRGRFELYLGHLREPLAPVSVPLTAPDEDVLLDLKRAIDQVWTDGRYYRTIAYDKPCVPRLPPEDQAWATERWREWRKANAALFAEAVE